VTAAGTRGLPDPTDIHETDWVGGGHVIVCGLRGVGLRTVEQLHQSGVPVVVVDDHPDLRLARIIQGWGVTHIHGSAQLGNGLAEAGLATASAVICVETNELATLEIAMPVREARPDVRLVVQLANPSVGRALERVLGAGTILDAAALAAPSFVEVCLRQPSHEVELGEVQFAVVEVAVEETDGVNHTLRGHFGNLAPVAVVPGDGGEIVCCPGRDHPVVAGDRVAMLGTPTEIRRAGIDLGGGSGPVGATIPRLTRSRRRLTALRESNGRGLALVAAGLLVLVVVATVVIRVSYQLPADRGHPGLLASVYFTVETVATVGYGDYNFSDQSAWFQVFGIVLIVLGVLLVSTVFALFTNFLSADASTSRSVDAGCPA